MKLQNVNQLLKYKKSNSMIELVLPGESVLDIGAGINLRNLDYEKIVIELEPNVVLDDQSIELFEIKRQRLAKVVACYYIKQGVTKSP